jgi:hypothetical protein
VRARVSVCAQPSRRPSFRWSANPRWALSRQGQTPRAQAQRPRAAGFPSRTGDNACALEVPDLQGFWALVGGFLFAEVGLGGVRFAEFGTRLETSRAGERRRPPGNVTCSMICATFGRWQSLSTFASTIRLQLRSMWYGRAE